MLDSSLGIAHLHDNCIVHRDIAARNMLLKGGRIKVTDFGMSREKESKGESARHTQNSVGPLKFMAPESLSEQVYSYKSDVWSTGILFWEILTGGAVPYGVMSAFQVVPEILSNGLRVHPPEGTNEKLVKLLDECFQLDPLLRPTIKAIIEILKTVDKSRDKSIERKKNTRLS